MWVSVALVNVTDLGLIDMFLINLNAEIVACMLSFRKSRHKPNLESISKYGFSPDLGGKNGVVLSMRMQVILDSSLSPYMGREERRVQGLDYDRPGTAGSKS